MANDDDESVEKHESYVTVGFSRRSGNPGRLFGSHIKTHQSYVTLKISQASRVHSLGSDRFHSSFNGDIVEVDMSAAQFAELLTTMNVGSGVPGTLRRVFNKSVEDPPDASLEVEKIRQGFEKRMRDLAVKCHDNAKVAYELLSQKSLSAVDRDKLRNSLRSVMTEVSANVPFMLEQFEEATEKVVASAKAEIDAFTTHSIILEGVKAIEARSTQPTVPELPRYSEDSDSAQTSSQKKL